MEQVALLPSKRRLTARRVRIFLSAARDTRATVQQPMISNIAIKHGTAEYWPDQYRVFAPSFSAVVLMIAFSLSNAALLSSSCYVIPTLHYLLLPENGFRIAAEKRQRKNTHNEF